MRATCLCFVVVLALLSIFCPVTLRAQSSIYGDVNADGTIDIGDVVYLINYLFRTGPEPDPVFIGDANGDDVVDIGDIVHVVNYLYRSGPPPQNFYVPPDSTEIVFDPDIGGYVVENRITVAFYDSISRDTIDAKIQALSASIKGELREINQFCLEVSDPDGAMEVLLADPSVEIVAREIWTNENSGEKARSYPDDDYFIPYLKKAFLLARIPLAWETRNSAQDVVVAIIGDGVTGGHPDLGSNLAFRRSCCGIGGNPDPTLDEYGEPNNHETYIAGEIGAIGNNATGVTGVLWQAHLLSAKCYHDAGDYSDHTFSASLIFSVNYAAEKGKKLVVSTSIGPEYHDFGLGIMKSIKYAWSQGAVIIAAAPNYFKLYPSITTLEKGYPPQTGPHSPGYAWPSSFPEVLAVGSVDSLDNHWSAAPVRGPQVIAAPGPGWGVTASGYGPGNPGYPPTFSPAHSFTAPIVAGIAALTWNENLSKTSEQVLQMLENSADPVDPAENFGLGRINAYRAIMAAQGSPVPENRFPGNPTWADPPGAGGNGFVALSWNAPTANYDGTPLDDAIWGYYVYRKLEAAEPTGWTLRKSLGAGSTEWTDNLVVNGTTYEYMISATDMEGQEGYASDVQSFTPMLSYYYIKGYVRDGLGGGVAGCTLTLSGSASDQYETAGDGYYQFLALEGGLYYKVVPSKTDWVFDPDSIPFNPLSSDMNEQNFTGTPYYYIKGYVRADGVPMEGVWMELSGGASEYVQTNASGYYEFLNLEGLLNYTVRPTKEGWYFDPDDSTFAPLDGNKDNVDFDGYEIQTHFYIKGYIHDSYRAPMESVTVTLSGGASDTYLTGPSGYYEFLDLAGGPDYTVTPSKPAWGFFPPDTQFTPLNSDQDNVDFTGTLCPQYYIKGWVLDTAGVGISDVVVHLTGAAVDSDTTVSDGYYEFLDLQGCLSYTVTPSKQGRCFSPPARDYTSLQADQDSQNFIGVPCPPSTDFKVTDFVSGSAGYPCVSANNAGSFVVGWKDDRLGSDHEVFAQRYVSIAQPVGSNFKVNDAGAPWGYDEPGVAITANGSFVLAWRDRRTDNQHKIYSQRYDSSGNSLGSNFRVDSDPTGTCRQPGIAIDGSRNFTVVWHDHRNGTNDVFGQRYDSLGSPLGSNFVVNDVTTDDQDFASIGMNSSGSFVVCWLDNRSLSGQEVYCRRFNSAGSPLGASLKVNTIGPPSAYTVREPDVTIDDAGNFVVVWQTSFYAVPVDSFHIYAQRYNSSGSPIGSNFRVNDVGGSPATNQHYNPAVAMDGGGNFVIVWHDLRNGGQDIYGQEYNSSGSPIGSNFRVDDDTANALQRDPDVSANGTYIYVTWIDGRGGGYYAIYAKVIPWTP